MRDGANLFLGLAKKSGMLVIGEESVRSSARAGEAKIILSAADAAARSVRHAEALARGSGIIHVVLPYGKDDLGALVGRGSPGMLAITDIGFAAAFASKLAQEDGVKYGGAAAVLQERARVAAERKRASGAGSGTRTRMRRAK